MTESRVHERADAFEDKWNKSRGLSKMGFEIFETRPCRLMSHTKTNRKVHFLKGERSSAHDRYSKLELHRQEDSDTRQSGVGMPQFIMEIAGSLHNQNVECRKSGYSGARSRTGRLGSRSSVRNIALQLDPRHGVGPVVGSQVSSVLCFGKHFMSQ